MSTGPHAAAMEKQKRAAEVEALLREIQRYLAYVDAFRAGGSQKPPERSERRAKDG